MLPASKSLLPVDSWRNWPVMLAHAGQIQLFTSSGEIDLLPASRVRGMAQGGRPVLTCYAPRLHGLLAQGGQMPVFADLLELFVFLCPGIAAPPTVKGVADALHCDLPCDTAEDASIALPELVELILAQLAAQPDTHEHLRGLLSEMTDWVWTHVIRSVIGEGEGHLAAWDVFSKLPVWEAAPPRGVPPQLMLEMADARDQLDQLQHMLHGDNREVRDDQVIYAEQVSQMFAPPDHPETPQVVLAEAGTGVGKTLGYLAPALAWTERTGGQVWISTFTKALQRQIEGDLRRLPASADPKRPLYAVRKGRENYLCLLNLDDLIKRLATTRSPRDSVLAGILARWVLATRDGDLSGNDFPAWLTGLFGTGAVTGLADKRGECIYAGCPHFSRCFVERSLRQAESADIVISNHALTLLQAGNIQTGQPSLPTRMVLDEGHHLFSAADSIFSVALTGQTGTELRRWLLGPEDGSRTSRSRLRGLKRRLEDLCASDAESEKALIAIIQHARVLPSYGWTTRIQGGVQEDNDGLGAFEQFLGLIHGTVQTRVQDKDSHYSQEIVPFPLPETVTFAIPDLLAALQSLQSAMLRLGGRCLARIAEDDGELDAPTRNRLEAAAAGLQMRANNIIGGWVAVLNTLASGEPNPAQTHSLIVEKSDGQLVDVGALMQWIDPTAPMAQLLKPQVLGLTVTSATLRDQGVAAGAEPAQIWHAAKQQTGVVHMTPEPHMVALKSPFNYAEQTRVLLITDVAKDDNAAIAGAYRALFLASRGGGLGLFTSIQRLRAVHQRILGPLSDAGLNVYAQHIDPMDTGTLVDIFRHDRHACLMGTDALRDGIDVPGDSLRVLIFDKIPWPRPTLAHQARRLAFGGRGYDDRLTRYRLKQAYGRLVRRADDKGVFVLLDSALPSKLQNAFPPGVAVQRVGLQEAAAIIRGFLPADEKAPADKAEAEE